MNDDSDDPGPDPALTPEAERRIRDLLAAERVDAATPPAVVARLDRQLADLQAERAAPSTPRSENEPPTGHRTGR